MGWRSHLFLLIPKGDKQSLASVGSASDLNFWNQAWRSNYDKAPLAIPAGGPLLALCWLLGVSVALVPRVLFMVARPPWFLEGFLGLGSSRVGPAVATPIGSQWVP